MNIVIYGVSRSGKDHLIEDLVVFLNQHSHKCEHLRGSYKLNEISKTEYGMPFSALSANDRNTIRQRFASDITKSKSDNQIIVVDGHCSFFSTKNNSIYDVITENDLEAYDLFFYLDTDSEIILSRLDDSSLTLSDINNLKNHEIEVLTRRLLHMNKELHVIDYHDSYVLEYILSVINGKYSSESIAKELTEKIDVIDEDSSVILLDCDKTLSLEDSTSIALEAKGIPEDELKRIYRNDRYTNYQAARAKRFIEEMMVFDESSTAFVATNIHLNMPLIDDLKSKCSTAKLIAITAGNSSLWQDVLTKYGLDILVLDSDYLVSKYVKYYVLKELQSKCKYVLPIGDSMIDSLMLSHANKAYLISNKGYREKIYQLLSHNNSIHQLSYNSYHYDSIRTDIGINEIKCLEPNENIMNLVTKCKSSSGVEGSQLRHAHYKLGLEIGNMISNDNPHESFCVVIMMRSGLPFGQGIADYLDCAELFCHNNNVDEIIHEINTSPELSHLVPIICDGVVNSGKTVNTLVSRISRKAIIATNVISTKYKSTFKCPIYATRISSNSYVGAKQRIVSDGKGPDTSDRLFKTM